jgi:hypothetical protein
MIPPEIPGLKELGETGDGESGHADPGNLGRVQCPNCCRLAYVTRRSMGLLFYRCELCETLGATPDPDHHD